MILGPRDMATFRFFEWAEALSVSSQDFGQNPIVSSQLMISLPPFFWLSKASLARRPAMLLRRIHNRLAIDRGGGGCLPCERGDRAGPSSGCSNVVGFR